MNDDVNKKPTILFIPETGIYPFLRGLSVLGSAISKSGSPVKLTRCTGQMIRCPMLTMNQLPVNASQESKDKICKLCIKNFSVVKNKYNFSSIELKDLVKENVRSEINELVDKASDLLGIVYRGFPVGKISQYDFILETKFPYEPAMPESQKAIFIAYVKNTALTVVMADEICKQYDPSLFLTFNEYAQCQAVRFSAQKHGIRRMAMTYPVNFNVDASRFSIWEKTCEAWRYQHCQNWSQGKEIPILKENVWECWNDIVFRMFGFGSHIFSSKKHNDPGYIFKNLNLKLNRKTIVVYTSSQDERVSVDVAMKIWGEDQPPADAFVNQIEWLKMLKDYASQRNDVQIVVRIHPREGAKKFGFDSKHLIELRQNFKENSENFYIVWPNDEMSSYDLMELADVCLVAWSLMGQEAARVGIPVLSFAGKMFYPDDDFMQVATSKDEYKRKLDSIIDMSYNWSHLTKAFRFYHWRIFMPSLDLRETVPLDFENKMVWPDLPTSKIHVVSKILRGTLDLIEYNKTKWLDSLPLDAAEQETSAMKRGIRMFIYRIFFPPKASKLMYVFDRINRFVWYFLTKKSIPFGFKRFADYELKYSDDVSKLESFIEESKSQGNLIILVADGKSSVLVKNGKIFRRMSPVLNRLAKLHGEATA